MASIGCSSLAPDVETIDARGLKCPLPVLKLEKRLAEASKGTTIVVLASDPMARIDIPLYCRQNGHICVEATSDDHMQFVVTVERPSQN